MRVIKKGDFVLVACPNGQWELKMVDHIDSSFAYLIEDNDYCTAYNLHKIHKAPKSMLPSLKEGSE